EIGALALRRAPHPRRTAVLKLEMTDKMGAVAKAHPPRNVRDALLRVLQQPAGIAQSGAADKFTCRFPKLGVKQAIKLTLAQLDVLSQPGGAERARQVLFDDHDRPAQPRVRNKGDIGRPWRRDSVRRER